MVTARIVLVAAVLSLVGCSGGESAARLAADLPVPERLQTLIEDPAHYAFRHTPASDLDAERYEVSDEALGHVEVSYDHAETQDGTRYLMLSLEFPDQECSVVDVNSTDSLQAFSGGVIIAIDAPSWSATQVAYRIYGGPLDNAYLFIGAKCPRIVETAL